MVEQAGGPVPAFGGTGYGQTDVPQGGGSALPPPPAVSDAPSYPPPGSSPSAAGMPAADGSGPPEPPWPVVDPNQQAPGPSAIPQGGGPPGWAPGMPLPGQQGGAPAPPEIDYNMLNDAVIAAREQTLHSQFKSAYDRANTAAEQTAIDREYQASVQMFRLGVQRARDQHESWVEQTQMHYSLMAMVPKFREMKAGELAQKYANYGVTPDQLLRDEHGREITSRQEMEMRAYYMASTNYRLGVRARGGRDAGLSSGGGQPSEGPDDLSNLSREDFLKFREQNKRSGGALLYRLGNQ